jgi:succinylarginine dihydrolase
MVTNNTNSNLDNDYLYNEQVISLIDDFIILLVKIEFTDHYFCELKTLISDYHKRINHLHDVDIDC